MVCKCRDCWTFAEWALENLGSDYGLPAAKGHQKPVSTVVEPPRWRDQWVSRPEVSQPWEPRKSRYAA